jgi:hypothetical protein
VGGLCWSPSLLTGQDLTLDIARAGSALRDFTTRISPGHSEPQLRAAVVMSGCLHFVTLCCGMTLVTKMRTSVTTAPPCPPAGWVPAAPPARAAAAATARHVRVPAATPPVPLAVPFIPVVTEHETPVDGAAASAADVHSYGITTEQEEHIDTPHSIPAPQVGPCLKPHCANP